jgi:hypothetical protein
MLRTAKPVQTVAPCMSYLSSRSHAVTFKYPGYVDQFGTKCPIEGRGFLYSPAAGVLIYTYLGGKGLEPALSAPYR